MIERSIYFIQVGDDGPIKIGVSDSPYRRLHSLQGAHHERLHLIGLTPGTRFDEGRMHDELQDFALGHEWYEPHADVLAMIQEPLAVLAETLDRALDAREHLRLAIAGLRDGSDDAVSNLRTARDLLVEALRQADEVAA